MLHLALNLTLVVLAVFWLGIAYWVNRDARRRSRSILFVGVATLLGLVPVAGPLGYLLVRPPETRNEVKARRVEADALESWLSHARPRCTTCLAGVEDTFLVCPVCATRLKEPCAGCAAPLAPTWLACPFCALPVEEPAAFDLDAALTAEVARHGLAWRPGGRWSRKPQQAQAS